MYKIITTKDENWKEELLSSLEEMDIISERTASYAKGIEDGGDIVAGVSVQYVIYILKSWID